MGETLFPMRKKRLLGVVTVLGFGLTSLFAVLSLEALVAPTFVLAFFVLLPLIAILGDDLSIVANEDEPDDGALVDDVTPVERLRARYANGEIDEAEFERKLDRLLETEDLERESFASDSRSQARSTRDRSVELE